MAIEPWVTKVDFMTCTLEELQNIDYKFSHCFKSTGIVHGYSLWFDAIFRGSRRENEVVLSPHAPDTHWF
jgi:hypothetical protein